MANVIKLAENMPLPIAASMHKVLLSCGFNLIDQVPFQLIYEIEHDKKLIFTNGGVIYSKWRDCSPAEGFPAWNILSNLRFGFDVEPIKYLDILNALGAIDYFSMPEFQQIVRSTFNESSYGINGFDHLNHFALFHVAYDKGQA